jgi:hypothetical protein
MSAPSVIRLLGYLGLIPFVVPAVLAAFNSDLSGTAIQVAETYSFGIICFLTGSWWGLSCSSNNRALILFSNFYFLVAFFLLLKFPLWWPLTASLLLMSIFALELKTSLFPSLPHFYRQMRGTLTILSSASMMFIHIAG